VKLLIIATIGLFLTAGAALAQATPPVDEALRLTRQQRDTAATAANNFAVDLAIARVELANERGYWAQWCGTSPGCAAVPPPVAQK
jgi:hypothetical protein